MPNIAGVFYPKGYVLFDESMGDMDGEDNEQKLKDSVMVKRIEDRKSFIYPKDKFEFVKVPKKKDNSN